MSEGEKCCWVWLLESSGDLCLQQQYAPPARHNLSLSSNGLESTDVNWTGWLAPMPLKEGIFLAFNGREERMDVDGLGRGGHHSTIEAPLKHQLWHVGSALSSWTFSWATCTSMNHPCIHLQDSGLVREQLYCLQLTQACWQAFRISSPLLIGCTVCCVVVRCMLFVFRVAFDLSGVQDLILIPTQLDWEASWDSISMLEHISGLPEICNDVFSFTSNFTRDFGLLPTQLDW